MCFQCFIHWCQFHFHIVVAVLGEYCCLDNGLTAMRATVEDAFHCVSEWQGRRCHLDVLSLCRYQLLKFTFNSIYSTEYIFFSLRVICTTYYFRFYSQLEAEKERRIRNGDLLALDGHSRIQKAHQIRMSHKQLSSYWNKIVDQSINVLPSN